MDNGYIKNSILTTALSQLIILNWNFFPRNLKIWQTTNIQKSLKIEKLFSFYIFDKNENALLARLSNLTFFFKNYKFQSILTWFVKFKIPTTEVVWPPFSYITDLIGYASWTLCAAGAIQNEVRICVDFATLSFMIWQWKIFVHANCLHLRDGWLWNNKTEIIVFV